MIYGYVADRLRVVTHVQHELPDDDPDVLAGVPLAGPNPWPAEPSAMRETCLQYMAAMKALAMTLVRSIARGFGVPEDYFDPEFERPTEFLRLLRFWPQDEGAAAGTYGAAPHTGQFACFRVSRSSLLTFRSFSLTFWEQITASSRSWRRMRWVGWRCRTKTVS